MPLQAACWCASSRRFPTFARRAVASLIWASVRAAASATLCISNDRPPPSNAGSSRICVIEAAAQVHAAGLAAEDATATEEIDETSVIETETIETAIETAIATEIETEIAETVIETETEIAIVEGAAAAAAAAREIAIVVAPAGAGAGAGAQVPSIDATRAAHRTARSDAGLAVRSACESESARPRRRHRRRRPRPAASTGRRVAPPRPSTCRPQKAPQVAITPTILTAATLVRCPQCNRRRSPVR